MIKFVTFLASLHFVISVNAQTFEWAKRLGGTDSDRASSIALDPFGNVYTTGDFNQYADFDPGTGIFQMYAADGEVFISKLNNLGEFLWAGQIHGGAARSSCIAVDSDESMYLAGPFGGSGDFNPGNGTYTLTSFGGYDVSVIKLNPSGTLNWAKQLGGTNIDWSKAISVDNDGSVITTGWFMGTSDFDPSVSTFNLTSSSFNYEDIFISKLDADGNFLWAKQIGGKKQDMAFDLETDGEGNVFVTGHFNDSVDFDPGPEVYNLITANNQQDIFLLKLNSDGEFQWAKQMGGNSVEYASGLAVDTLGNVYITGDFQGVAEMDPGPSVFKLSCFGGYDSFVMALDSSGNFLWADQLGGPSFDRGLAISTGGGYIFSTGFFSDTADFDPGTGIYNLITSDYNDEDIFTSVLDKDGHFVMATMAGYVDEDQGLSIATDGAGTFLSTGFFGEVVDFNPFGDVDNLVTASSYEPDVFIQKMSMECTDADVPQTIASSDSICTGGAAMLTIVAGYLNSALNWKWYKDSCTGIPIDSGLYTIVTPSVNSVYYARGVGGCVTESACDEMEIAVNELPEISITGDTILCYGEGVILKAHGAASYLWNNWATSETIFVTPLTSTTYTVIGTDASGCSGMATVTVIVNLPDSFDTSVLVSGPVLTAVTGGLNYQWMDCITGQIIPGATEQSYTAVQNSSYAVIETQAGCSDTSECYGVYAVGIGGKSPGDAFYLFPNPAGKIVTLQLNCGTECSLVVFDIFQTEVLRMPVVDKVIQLDISDWKNQVYFFKIQTAQKSFIKKLIRI